MGQWLESHGAIRYVEKDHAQFQSPGLEPGFWFEGDAHEMSLVLIGRNGH